MIALEAVRSMHLSFDAAVLEPTCAHGGLGEVLFRRALSRREGSALNFIDFTLVPPGVSIGLHRHTRGDEEIYVVLKGRD